MKKGLKTLAMWLIMGIILIVLISSILDNSQTKMTYSELMIEIESGKVENIEISADGKKAYVVLKANPKIEKEVNIPSLDSFMDKVSSHLVDGSLTLEERSQSAIITMLSLLSPFGILIIFFVFWFLFMGNSQGNAGNKTMSFGKSRARMMGTGEKTRVTFDDVAGVDEEKEELEEIVEFLKSPKKFTDMGARIPKGVLLVGQPGTGKTLLAKAVASESEANFISIKGPELLSKWVGESEQGVREVFRKAKQTAPTVIFFDEIDSIASTRSANDSDSGVTKRVVNQLLTEMDGLEELEDVAIIAATNRPDILDAGLMRPGRFDRHIKVDLPNEDARLSIFKVHTEGMPLADDVSLEKLAKQTDGYVGADIEAVCREAAMLTLRNNLDAENVPYKYFKEALEKVKPSNSPGDQVQYI